MSRSEQRMSRRRSERGQEKRVRMKTGSGCQMKRGVEWSSTMRYEGVKRND